MIGLRALARFNQLQERTLSKSRKLIRSFSSNANHASKGIGIPARFLITFGTLTLGITAINYQLLNDENESFLKAFHSIVPEPHASEYLKELRGMYSAVGINIQSLTKSTEASITQYYNQFFQFIHDSTLHAKNSSAALSKYLNEGIDSLRKIQNDLIQSWNNVIESLGSLFDQGTQKIANSLDSIVSYYDSAILFSRNTIRTIDNFYTSSINYILNTYNQVMFWIYGFMNPESVQKPPPIVVKKEPIARNDVANDDDESEKKEVGNDSQAVESSQSDKLEKNLADNVPGELEEKTDDIEKNGNEASSVTDQILERKEKNAQNSPIEEILQNSLESPSADLEVKSTKVIDDSLPDTGCEIQIMPAVAPQVQKKEENSGLLESTLEKEEPAELKVTHTSHSENIDTTLLTTAMEDVPTIDKVEANDMPIETVQVENPTPYVALIDSFVVPEREQLLPSLKTEMSELASQIHTMSDSVNNDELLKESLKNSSVNLLNMVGILDYLEADQVSTLMNSLHEQATHFYKEISELKQKQEQSLAEVVVTMSEAAIDAQNTLEKRHQKEMADQVDILTEAFLNRLEEGLQSQATEIDAFWKKHVKEVLDNERYGRLARLDALALHIKALDAEYVKSMDHLNTTSTANVLQTLIHPLVDALKNGQSEKAVMIWKKLEVVVENSNDELVKTVYQSILPSDLMKFQSPEKLVHLFRNQVAPQAKKAIFVPHQSGIISYIFATAMSYLILPTAFFGKTEIRQGDTNEIKLCNADIYASQGDFESCVRVSVGSNGLKPSWARYILQDWAVDAWETLRVLKAIEVLRVWSVVSSVSEK